jgi:hypothetical protein
MSAETLGHRMKAGMDTLSSPFRSTDIPHHLLKKTLTQIEKENGQPSLLWNERGRMVERRVQTIISTLPFVEEVVRHENGSREDQLGHDLTITLKGESPTRIVYCQVKSSRDGIVDYKRSIRDKLPADLRWNMQLVSEWMTNNNIILLNGSETKSPDDVLGSFNAQLIRIQSKDSLQKAS